MSVVRVRFAPSPTGNLHVGGARTALFNWLFARQHNGGNMILRIDDTDLERSTETSRAQILSALHWLGLDWDEGPEKGGACGPYLQSERLEIYRKAAEELLANGAAYYCYCTPEELEVEREAARAKGLASRYSGRCRTLTPEDRSRLEAEGRKRVVRLKVPEEGQTGLDDLIRGRVVFDNSVLDEFVILKSNGLPVYNFATVVDDHQMGITHIIRAEEHLSNTPRQVQVYGALGYTPPFFAHVSMILAPDRSKLSKRHGATSVEEFRDQGYLPEALLNYLGLLGWSPGDEREIMSLEEMARDFSLERVNKTAAVYDVRKLTWMNGHYLRAADPERIFTLARPFLEQRGLLAAKPAVEELNYARRVVALVRDRANTLAEVAEASDYFLRPVEVYEEKGARKHFQPETAGLLRQLAVRLSDLEAFGHQHLEEVVRSLAEEREIAASKIIHPVRLAVSGRTTGPGLFEILETLGCERVLERLDRAAGYIEERSPQD